MGRTLYMQCDSGISGDMVVGALLDAGADEEGLRHALAELGVEGYEVRVSRKKVGALVGCDFDVVVDGAHENHDHDMEWLYGGVEDGPLSDDDHRSHHHDHEKHDHHHGHHDHRNLADIRHIVEHADLPAEVSQTAMRIFGIIAEAEAAAHGMTVETVHFHEVGAIDSIVDVVAAAWCLHDLAIDDVVVSSLAEGEGHVRCAHGVLSIPVPAVSHIVQEHGIILRRASRPVELVTPTGAAIAAAFRTTETLPQTYRIVGQGLGCGKRAYDPPSSLRAIVMEDAEASGTRSIGPVLWKLETEVDDCTGEALGYVLDRLYDAGALEAHFLPVFMKKGRPGYQIEVLCPEGRIDALERVLFSDTTTIGVRRHPMDRTALPRTATTLQTSWGPVRAKQVTLPDGMTRTYVEHESVAHIAQEQGVGYQDVVRSLSGPSDAGAHAS